MLLGTSGALQARDESLASGHKHLQQDHRENSTPRRRLSADDSAATSFLSAALATALSEDLQLVKHESELLRALRVSGKRKSKMNQKNAEKKVDALLRNPTIHLMNDLRWVVRQHLVDLFKVSST